MSTKTLDWIVKLAQDSKLSLKQVLGVLKSLEYQLDFGGAMMMPNEYCFGGCTHLETDCGNENSAKWSSVVCAGTFDELKKALEN